MSELTQTGFATTSERESVKVLRECIDLQNKKSQDYQNPNSNIVQSMHYRRGVDTIHDMIHQKLLRAQSLLEGSGGQATNFESLEDTYKDMINYCSFAVSYLRGRMEGQDQHKRDIFNRAINKNGDLTHRSIKAAVTSFASGDANWPR